MFPITESSRLAYNGACGQPIYNKIGVSTRAAAALWAMEQGVVGSSRQP